MSIDNWAATVDRLYVNAVRTFGMQRRLRVDKGGENIGIAAWQILQSPDTNHPVYVDRSVYNQRIERLFGDMNRAATEPYIVFREWTALHPEFFPNGFGVRFLLMELFQGRI